MEIFSEYVRKLKAKEDEILVSFDVTSLYTNVPIKETLVIIKTLMENDADLQNKTNFPPKDLFDITEFLHGFCLMELSSNKLIELQWDVRQVP